jgi:transcriptional regulator NrdR family protein
MTNQNTSYEYTALYIRAFVHNNLSMHKESPEKYLYDEVNALVKRNIVLAEIEKVTSNEVEAIYDIRFNFAASKMIDLEIQNTLAKIKSLEYVSHAYIKETNTD